MEDPIKHQFITNLKKGISSFRILSKATSLFVFLFVIVFSVSGLAQMTVKDSDDNTLMEVNDEGIVGSILLPGTDVGPSDPHHKLYNVLGNLYWNGNLLSPGGDNLGNHTATQNINLNGHWLSRSNDDNGIFINGSGWVGVGTSNPKTKFHVKGGVKIENSNSGLSITFGTNSAILGYFYDVSYFYPNIRLFNGSNFLSGKVGISAHSFFSPDFLLHISENSGGQELAMFHNTSKTSDSDGIVVRAGPNSNPGTAVDYVIFQDGDGTTIGSIDGNGSGGVRYNTTSDARLKTNIRDYTDALTTILKIKVRKYEMKSAPGKEKIGMIAQELQKVYPYAVSGSPDSDVETDPMMIDYGKLTPLLVRGIQELKKENEKIQKLNSKLISENKELKREITEIKTVFSSLNNKNKSSYVKINGLGN